MVAESKRTIPFGWISILLGVVSFLCIGFTYPPLVTLPLGFLTAGLELKKNPKSKDLGMIGLVINLFALLALLALHILVYQMDQSLGN